MRKPERGTEFCEKPNGVRYIVLLIGLTYSTNPGTPR